MDILEKLENDFAKSLQTEDIDGSELVGIKPLPWYPENLAWHSNYSRKQIRKNQTLERFHEFLKLENEVGNITRQEAVSMVPPLFLDVHPDHFVLDMCAAPGSKTFQLLEMIHHRSGAETLPDGMVVANDVDIQRCNLLIHQTKRMCTANLVVTTNEAQQFPGCQLRRGHVHSSKTGNFKEPDMKQLLFDRVLCDVPCSGDGTLRKAPDIWRKWNPGLGNGLHGLQVQIAMRGLSLLKVGGRMVYSTCSMNPVEDEAVVAEVLRRCGGSVELVDVSAELPELVRRPGLKKWRVQDKGMWLTSYRDVTKLRRGGVVPGMFPSGKSYEDTMKQDSSITNGIQMTDDTVSTISDLEEISELPLERCMRIVPHDQNTGAFFIAVLQKLSPLPAIQEKPAKKSNKNSHSEILANDLKEDLEETAIAPSGDVEVEADAAAENGRVVDTDITDAADDKSNEIALDSKPPEMPQEIEAEESQPSVNNGGAGPEMVTGKRKLPVQGRWTGIDPVLFYKAEDVIARIKEFYGIKESFPFDGHLVTRNSDTGSVKRIYYVSKSVKDVLELNLSAGQPLKIASVGIKMFERQSSKEGALASCAFRISSEGLPLLLPHMTKQILHASIVDFKHLLQYKSIKFCDFVEAEFGKKSSELLLGCCVVMLNKAGTTLPDSEAIAVGCWRGKNSVSVMMTALDCQELLERLEKYLASEEVPNLEENKSSEVEKVENETGKEADAIMPESLG
ncbi:RNA methyltransferase [Lithospermum erythrorhizon]|uniref:RNA methyltransferase n=1 Tax=Lithospermum erythrorhizon TaxID=34254 RepID=A0AAV3P4X1_LITER